MLYQTEESFIIKLTLMVNAVYFMNFRKGNIYEKEKDSSIIDSAYGNASDAFGFLSGKKQK